MKYRTLKRLGERVSVLGFGCMRLPTIKGEAQNIDEPEATRILRHALDNGVNYVDTAYGYHGGNSERFLGRALTGGYRERVFLVTKLPTWLVKEYGDFDRLLEEQLNKLQTDHVDAYFLHGLSKESWSKVHQLGVLEWAERAIARGRFRALGFSFHDSLAAFKEIVDAYDNWGLCQIQYNYVDEFTQAGTEGLLYAANRGISVIVMEPLRGGRLADLPASVKSILDNSSHKRTPADWALQWVWNHGEVSVALSGMSTMQQVVENLASADQAQVGSLSDEELATLAQARAQYCGMRPIPCTDCRYCTPCPNGVWIPHNLELYNRAVLDNAFDQARRSYSQPRRSGEDSSAGACIQCHECEERCPQKIPISEWMQKIHATLGIQG